MTFEELLADPNEQFDRRGELLESIQQYANAPSETVSVPPPRTTRAPCQVHKTHVPRSHINEVHHIWPKGDGGPDVAANKVICCGTGHSSIHDLLNKYRQANGSLDWETLRHYARMERHYALLGWQRIQQQAMVGPHIP